MKRLVPLGGLWVSPFADVICYPRLTRKELCVRLGELERLGITAVEFTGEKIVDGVRVLGKGCVGVVVKAYAGGGGVVALKVRRTDADRKEMKHEAEMLRAANGVGVGPRFLGQSRDFLIMEYVRGRLLPDWLQRAENVEAVRRVLRSVLGQCFRLDACGLDHGELSHAPKHVIVRGGKPVIVDFESASTTRRVQNVTALAQYLFIAKNQAGLIQKKIGRINQRRLKQALQVYKAEKTRKNFDAVLRAAGL